MHGQGQMKMLGDGRVIEGRWMRSQLQGKATVRHASGEVETIRYRDGSEIIQR